MREFVQVRPERDSAPGTDTLPLCHFDETSGTTAYADDKERTKQVATVPSGAWSVNHGEFGVGSNAREYASDKVGDRTERRLSEGSPARFWMNPARG